MARWLLDVDSGIPERLLELMESLPEGRKYFYPFQDDQFRNLFDVYISHHKHKVSTFYRRYATLRQKFRVYLRRDKQPPWWTAEADDYSITVFRRFFGKRKFERLSYVEHELTHVIQGLLEKKKPGRKAVIEEEETEYAPRSYYNDWYEIEPWTKDFYREILHYRKRGKLKTAGQVVKWLRKNNYFKQFYRHNQERMIRKILGNL